MADIDSKSVYDFTSALSKTTKQFAETQKILSALGEDAQSAAKVLAGYQPSDETTKTISDASETIRKSFAADVLDAMAKDGKAARTARMKARDDLYGNFKSGLANTVTSTLGDVAGTRYQGDNRYVGAFLGAFAKSPKDATTDGTAAAGKESKTEDQVAKSTDFLVDLAAQAGEKIRASLGTMLVDVLNGNFKDIGKNFRTMLRQMLADAAASQISKLAGATLSWVGSAIGGLFGAPSSGGASWAGQYGANVLGGDMYRGAGSLSTSWWARGGAFSHGMPLRAFARGGIVNSPTLFPMATGTGLMGEAGPEAIMPLARGPDGRLGVRSSRGGSSGGVNNQISITVNVGSNGNAQSDTQAQSDDAGRQLAAMVEGKVKEVMAREQRQGGILWRMQHA